MEKQSSPSDGKDVTLAAYGLEYKVDDKTIFCTPEPLAASTVTKELNRLQLARSADTKGSFLDDLSRLSMQSVSAMDLTHQLNQLSFTLTSVCPQEGAAAAQDANPNLIQFSGNTDMGSSEQDSNKSDSLTDTSSRSSMGLIPSDMLNDCDLLNSLSGTELSASVLPLSTPKADQGGCKPRPPNEQDSSHSTLKEKTADSKDWSDSSHSKQDSKDMPWGRSQLETVKKRPENRREGGPRKGAAARGAVTLFAGHLLDDVAEGEELDQSVYNVELGEEDLKQLDAGVDFSDLEEDRLSGRESGDEDFNFDEPMLNLPTRGCVTQREEVEEEEEAGRSGARGERTLQADLAEAESRLGEGQESDEEGAAAAQLSAGLTSDIALDSRYFRQAPMSFAGDGEDSEVVGSHLGSLTASLSHHRGAAEGEHSLTKLRRQFMSGDGSENEIDTEDELEAASNSMALATRERGQGADEEDSDRSNLPLPVGLEDATSTSGTGCQGNKGGEERASQFSFLTRQRAEGDAAHSPLPWGGGDGSSGDDSDAGGGRVPAATARPPFRYVSGAAVASDQPVRADQPPIPSYGHTAEDTEPGLHPKYFLPTSASNSALHDSEVISPENLDGSTFRVEDLFKFSADVPPAVDQNQPGDSPKMEASGSGAQGLPQNPFEDQLASSFGSFGLGPEEEDLDTGAADRFAEKGGSLAELSREAVEQAWSPKADLSAKPAGGGFPPKGSGSFDGPFRKPRAPAPPRKKAERNETYEVDKSDSWKNATFQGTDALAEISTLERELKELGINVDDEDFHTAEGAQAMLEADEKQFEQENKFSEHHQLALAAEGLAWKREESGFSGFWGGEDGSPEHLETSIGTYIAARTETLGTLGGDPNIPRPEFGRPVSSPPHRTFPFKLMSPPSTASSLQSFRTDGEGDEEADQTMVSGDCTLEASALSPSSPPPKSAGPPASQQEQATASPEPKASDVTLRGELSSVLLDLTQGGGGDMTMEEVLSNSALLDFLKNHSYSNATDFASAIMKLTTTKKHRPREGGHSAVAEQKRSARGVGVEPGKRNEKPVAQDKSATDSTDPRKRKEKRTSWDKSETDSREPGKRNQKQPAQGGSGDRKGEEGASALSSSSGRSESGSMFTSTQLPRSSRLPLRVGAISSPPTENRPGRMNTKEEEKGEERTRSGSSLVPGSVPTGRSQSGQRRDASSASEDSMRDINRQSAADTSKRDGVPTRKSQSGQTRDANSASHDSARDINRQSAADTTKRDVSNQRGDKSQRTAASSDTNRPSAEMVKGDISQQRGEQNQSRAASGGVPPSMCGTESRRSRQLPSSESLPAGLQRQGPARTDAVGKKPVCQVRFQQDQASGTGSLQSSVDVTAKLKTSPERERDSGRSSSKKWEQHSVESKQDLSKGTNAFSAKNNALPLNIPAETGQERERTKGREQPTPQKDDNNSAIPTTPAGYDKEKWKDCESFEEQLMLQTPPQRLAFSSQPPASVGASLQQESFRPEGLLHSVSSAHATSPRTGPSSLPQAGVASLGGVDRSRPLSVSEPRSLGAAVAAGAYDQRPAPAASRDTAAAPQRPGSAFPPHAFPSSSSSVDVHRPPTLLTGNSLLRTEFAQKYLTPANGNARWQGGAAPPPSSHYLTHGSGIHVPPEHLSPEGGGGSCLSLPTPSSSLPTPSIYFPSSQSAQGYPGSRGGPPHSTAQGLLLGGNQPSPVEFGATSVYYELNEDLEQSTMLQGGVEGSALGSFWGRSPLYQSTPALEMGPRGAALSLMGSRLDECEVTTSGTHMVTPRVQGQLIQVQRAVDFQEFCCLGVSQKTTLPVTNHTAHSVACRFRLVRLLHNGNPVRLDQQSPFELKPKMSIGAEATENVPVLFVPKRPGEHVCHIEVYAQSLNPTLRPTISVVQLRAIAEVPQLQISPSVEVLDMGEVTWGGCLTRTLKLRNVKKASLPVRLSIWSGNSVWHCFTFDSSSGGGGSGDNSSDMSIISMVSRPESLGRNVVTVILPGCDSPSMAKTLEFSLYCRPPRKELTRTLAERAAEHIDAKIDIEVDTPVKCLPALSSVQLKATVGMPRLLIPTNHMSLTFRTKSQRNMQESITVNNSGNITMDVALSVAAFPECFRVSPSRLSIQPGARDQVAVVFSPQGSDLHHYQSLLQLDVEPEGPSYEIPLEGQVTSAGLTSSILTSKSFLAFHGVSLSQTRSLTVKLFNKDQVNAEHACVEIRQSADCFKLVSASGEWQQKCDVVIEPKETILLTVIFSPTAVQGYCGKLVIRKPDVHSSKYSIRLMGYGGRSVLTMSGACLTNSGRRWLELGSLAVSHNIMREIVLTNTGVRSVFVRGSAFYDMMCKQPVSAGRVAVEPNNFVLAPGCSMTVMVAMSPSQREVDLVQTRKEVVAVVQFHHGDEVMRQKYQRACRRDGSGNVHSWQAAFRQSFVNEAQDSVILEGSSVADSPDDSSAFFHHLESLCMALLAQPPPGHQSPSSNSMSVSTLMQHPPPTHTTPVPTPKGDSTTSSFSSLPTHSRTDPRVREDSRQLDSTGQFLVPSRPDSDEGDWTVKPDFLSLTVGENNQKMLKLINFSKQPLCFQLSWPPSSVVPEPQKGEIKPRSRLSIEVWLHMAWQQRLSDLPWRGAITISCNGQEKSVHVTVQKPSQSPHSLLPFPLPSPTSHPERSPQAATAMSTLDTTTSHSLQLASTNIHFTRARVNGMQESMLEVTNASLEPVQLKLAPFAPAYVKGSDESNTVKRVGFSVFTLPTTCADLLSQETIKLPVKFCPQTKGTFSQHWEIDYWPLASGKKAAQVKKTTRVSLTAEVSQEASSKKLTWDPVEQGKATAVSSSRTPLQEKHANTVDTGREERGAASAPDLQLLQSEVTFSSSRCGQVTQVKIEFKNSLDHNVLLEVDQPRPPFRIKHKTFKITKKRILKYPIEFNSSTAGSFADSMVFRAPELGKTFTVYLKGTAV